MAYDAADAVVQNSPWMAWNLILAFVPLALAAVLFRGKPRRGAAWWTGVLAFIVFLPNAAYVLTDVIHLVRDARRINSVTVVSVAIVPQYALFFLLGFEAYVLAIVAAGRYLDRTGRGAWVVPMEIMLHGLSAVGIYLGRFLRLNSWDLVTRPDAVADGWYALSGTRALIAMAFTFAVVTVLYMALKEVTEAVMARRQTPRLTL